MILFDDPNQVKPKFDIGGPLSHKFTTNSVFIQGVLRTYMICNVCKYSVTTLEEVDCGCPHNIRELKGNKARVGVALDRMDNYHEQLLFEVQALNKEGVETGHYDYLLEDLEDAINASRRDYLWDCR